MLSEKVASAAVSPHLYTPSYTQMQCYTPLWQLHSDFGDFSNGVDHVMKMTTTESSPDTVLLTQQAFCLISDVLARTSNMS